MDCTSPVQLRLPTASMHVSQECLGISLHGCLVLLSMQLSLQRSQHWWHSIFRLLSTGFTGRHHTHRASISIDDGVLFAQDSIVPF